MPSTSHPGDENVDAPPVVIDVPTVPDLVLPGQEAADPPQTDEDATEKPAPRRNAVLDTGPTTGNSTGGSYLPGLYLDVNRFDQEWEEARGRYVPRKAGPEVPELETEAYTKFAFAFVRFYSPGVESCRTEIQSWSQPFISAAEVVMKEVKNMSWKARPLCAIPELYLSFLDDFQRYLDDLESKPIREHSDALVIEHLDFFIRFMRMEYQEKLRSLRESLQHGRVTFDSLWGIFRPGTIAFATCLVSREPMAVYIDEFFYSGENAGDRRAQIDCHGIEEDGGRFGQLPMYFEVPFFVAAKKIDHLKIFPLQYHHQYPIIKEKLIERGRKWRSLCGIPRHMKFDSVAFKSDDRDYSSMKYKKVSIKSRIVLDKELFGLYEGSIIPSAIFRTLEGESLTINFNVVDFNERKEAMESAVLTDDQLLLAPAYSYGFSLGNKMWLMFPVEAIQPITWSLDSFNHLSLPVKQKELIESLVETHTSQLAPVDDFVEGKGRGLIFSLSGPPGVGKTLTAEATSELTRRPLYVVSANEIGITSQDLDVSLSRIFSISHSWDAIVLIDEADVFLQRRSLRDLERNAIVAVLLRKLEYFPGILFLTTNRVHIFDEALQSRIHVSLHYDELSLESRRSIWLAFLARAGVLPVSPSSDETGDGKPILEPTPEPSARTPPELWSSETIERLCAKPLNGRQIKNIVNTALVLARHRNQQLLEEHLWQVMKTNEPLPLDTNNDYDNERESNESRDRSTKTVTKPVSSIGGSVPTVTPNALFGMLAVGMLLGAGLARWHAS